MRDLSVGSNSVCSVCGDLVGRTGHPECSKEKQRLFAEENKSRYKRSTKVSKKKCDDFSTYVNDKL